MRKLLLVGCCLLVLAAAGLASDKLVSQWNCGKPSDAHSIDVGDQANHTYAVTKTSCTASKSDLKEKDGVGTEFEETRGSALTWHGVFVTTTENGDKIHYSYANSGKGMAKDGQFQSGSNKWSIVGGTGKFKSAKGEGTCTGKGNADGTATWDCTGSYTLE